MELVQLAPLFYEHSSYIRGCSPSTIKRYKNAIAQFTCIAGNLDVSAVTRNVAQDFFIKGRMERNWAAATYVAYLKSLKKLFEWCVNEGHVQENVFLKIDKPRLEKKIPPKLTKNQAMGLLETIDNYPWFSNYLRYRNQAMFSTFLFTGLRKTELLNLNCKEVDLESKVIHVKQGKGKKDRLIPICSKLASSLSRYIRERQRKQKACPGFFASLHKDMGLTETGLKLVLKKIRPAVDGRLTFHMLRHTFATLMLEGGCDIYSLSKMMGHSDISTTTIYLAASADHLKSQMGKHPLNENKLHQ